MVTGERKPDLSLSCSNANLPVIVKLLDQQKLSGLDGLERNLGWHFCHDYLPCVSAYFAALYQIICSGCVEE